MLFRVIRIQFHSEMAKLHPASPREITSPFTREVYPYYTQKHVITYTYSMEFIPWLSYFFPSRHARSSQEYISLLC